MASFCFCIKIFFSVNHQWEKICPVYAAVGAFVTVCSPQLLKIVTKINIQEVKCLKHFSLSCFEMKLFTGGKKQTNT